MDPATLAAMNGGMQAIGQAVAPAPAISSAQGGYASSGGHTFNFGTPAIRAANGELLTLGTGGNSLLVLAAGVAIAYWWMNR